MIIFYSTLVFDTSFSPLRISFISARRQLIMVFGMGYNDHNVTWFIPSRIIESNRTSIQSSSGLSWFCCCSTWDSSTLSVKVWGVPAHWIIPRKLLVCIFSAFWAWYVPLIKHPRTHVCLANYMSFSNISFGRKGRVPARLTALQQKSWRVWILGASFFNRTIWTLNLSKFVIIIRARAWKLMSLRTRWGKLLLENTIGRPPSIYD